MPKKYNMPEVKFLSIIITSGLVKVLMLTHKTQKFLLGRIMQFLYMGF